MSNLEHIVMFQTWKMPPDKQFAGYDGPLALKSRYDDDGTSGITQWLSNRQNYILVLEAKMQVTSDTPEVILDTLKVT